MSDISIVRTIYRGIKKLKRLPGKRVLTVAAVSASVVVIFVFLGIFLKTDTVEEEGLVAVKLTYNGSFKRGDTVYKLLKDYQIDNQAFLHIKKEMKKLKHNPSSIRPGDSYKVVCSSDGYLLYFQIKRKDNPFKFIEVVRSSDGIYSAGEREVAIKRNIQGVQGKIKSSLYEAMVKQGLSPDMVMRFVDVFQWEIDFLTESRKGDSYRLIWERISTDEGYMREGRILVGNYMGKETGNKLAFYFDPDDKGIGIFNNLKNYYDLKGNSTRRSFLRAPLSYRRISSYFSRKRFHPILRTYRPHLGIDYAAPRGTPVESIGDGKVIYKGWKSQYGKCVIIKHNSIYTTYYGHLSRFDSKIKKGKKVVQGQRIGFVGSTGLSTGPHLDFRIKKYGKLVNFLRLKLPPAKGIPAKNTEAFTKEKRRLLRYLAELDQTRDEKDIISFEDVAFSRGGK